MKNATLAKNAIYKTVITISALLVALTVASCGAPRGIIKDGGAPGGLEENYAPAIISPEDEAAEQVYTRNVSLYFPYQEGQLLGREERNIEYSANERLDKAVISQLIQGPSDDYPELGRIVNKDTAVVNVSTSGSCLFVTFNAAFLTPIEDMGDSWQEDETQLASVLLDRKNAILSIVNTMTSLPGITQVQILVDTEGDGLGYRIKRQEAGLTLTGDDADELLEALPRQYSANSTPSNVMATVYKCMQDKNYERFYSLIAKIGAQDRPMYSEWIDAFRGAEWTLESYEIHDVTVFYDGLSAEAYVSAKFTSGVSAPVEYVNLRVSMISESGVWKVDYSSVTSMIPVG